MFDSKTMLAQQTQKQKGEHKSISQWLVWTESWEIEVNCSDPKTPSSSQGISDKVSVIIDNMIATSFI